jgi:hypothetical protein
MNLKSSLDNPSLARTIARLEMRRGWNEACFAEDRIDHTVDTTSALPELKPATGRAPCEALLAAIVDGDLVALSRELALDSSSINDAIPGTCGKTLLHVATRLHSVRARNRLNQAHVYDQIAAALLAAGADPLARDDIKQFPSSYTDGMTPPCLRDRMMRAAAESQVGWKGAVVEPRSRLNATHPWAGNGKGRLTREAGKRGRRAGFRA